MRKFMAIKIVFFGNERIATAVNTTTPTIKTLVDSGFEICSVVVNNEKALSRKQRELEIETYATAQNIPVLKPRKLADISEQLREYSADIGVLVAYGKIIPQSIIDLFPHGIINIHPSLLPLHRGSIPIESILLNGADTTGVSIMSLQKEMDAGPVYSQLPMKVSGHETKQQLADTLLHMGSEQLSELIAAVVSGDITPIEQNHDLATYDEQISKEDGLIDWSKPASQLEQEVRAYAGWPQSTTNLEGIDCVITSATVLDEKVTGEPGSLFIHAKKLAVVCSENALLIDSIKPAGKKEMDSAGFLNGYKDRLNL